MACRQRNWHLTPALSPSDAEREKVQALLVTPKGLGNLLSGVVAARAEVKMRPVHQEFQLPRMMALTVGVRGGSWAEFRKLVSKPHARVGAS